MLWGFLVIKRFFFRSELTQIALLHDNLSTVCQFRKMCAPKQGQ